MTGKKIHIAAILMVLAILAIISFQCFWIYKNYSEEEQTLQIRTNAIFRSVANKLQAEKLKLDTNMQVLASGEKLPGLPVMAPRLTAIISDTAGKVPLTERSKPAMMAMPVAKPGLIIRSAPGRQIIINANADGTRDSLSWSGAMPLDSLKTDRIRSISLARPGAAFVTAVESRRAADSVVTISITKGENVVYQKKTASPDTGFRPTRFVNKAVQFGVAKHDTGRNGPQKKDNLQEYLVLTRLMEDGSFRNLLQRVDSIADTISVAELESRFSKALIGENFGKLRFYVTKDSLSLRAANETIDPTRSNEVTLGYRKPYYLRFGLSNSVHFILEKLTPQIILSLLLIAITILSFVLLYRSLIKQRRLTQIKNDLISNITHELKTPIATVSVAIEALKNFHAMDDPRRTKEYLDISGSELQRLSLLVDKVLRLSMFEKHQVELRMERFDLPQLTEEVIASMRLQFEKLNATVKLVVSDDDDLSIEADRLHITSVIFNLLDNALKYSKEHPEITVSISRNGSIVELKVADNGIGIPSAYRHKIFEKFFRVPGGDTHNVKGYGLGLSYVNNVVERHNGSITVESLQGKGSQFIIQLPQPI